MDRAHHPSVQRPLDRLRAFWADLDGVVRDIRQQKYLLPAEPALAGAGDRTGRELAVADPAQDPRRHAVDLLFRRLREAVLTHGGPSAPRSAYGAMPIDLGYIMAALADETLLYLDAWDGMELWSRTLLEERIYGTRSAGERLYDEIDQVLVRRTGDNDEIAVGLLVALTLGFRGRHRLFANAADIEAEADRLRGRLYQAIFYRDPPQRPDWQVAMGYPPPFEAGRLVRLPRLRPWLGAIGVVLLVYLVAGHVLWLHNFGELMTIADRVARSDAPGLR
jgi:type VI secretion system protein ImpK